MLPTQVTRNIYNFYNAVLQIETSDPKELNEEFLHDQLHPRKDLIRQKFAKPPKPAGSRGPRRIHNPQGEGASAE